MVDKIPYLFTHAIIKHNCLLESVPIEVSLQSGRNGRKL